MPVDRRVFGRAVRVPHGGRNGDVRLSPRAAAECFGQRHHPVRRSNPCRDPLHDRVYRRREIRLSQAISDPDKRHALHPRQGDRRGGLRRACACARHPHRARHLHARVLPDRGLRRMGGRIEDPRYHPALFPVLSVRRHVGKRGAALLVADPKRIPCVRCAVHLLLRSDHLAGAVFPQDVHAEPKELSHHAGRVAARGQERGADAFHAGAHFAAHLLHDRADRAQGRQAAEAPLRRAEPFAEASSETHRARKAQEGAEAKRRPVHAFAGVGGRVL